MSDTTNYDSVLVGYTDEPRYYKEDLEDENSEETLSSWSVKFKDSELKEMIDKYATSRNAEGQGGNVYVKLFMSKSGKPCCSVFDPNSEAAKTKRAAKQTKVEAVADDMPF